MLFPYVRDIITRQDDEWVCHLIRARSPSHAAIFDFFFLVSFSRLMMAADLIGGLPNKSLDESNSVSLLRESLWTGHQNRIFFVFLRNLIVCHAVPVHPQRARQERTNMFFFLSFFSSESMVRYILRHWGLSLPVFPNRFVDMRHIIPCRTCLERDPRMVNDETSRQVSFSFCTHMCV